MFFPVLPRFLLGHPNSSADATNIFCLSKVGGRKQTHKPKTTTMGPGSSFFMFFCGVMGLMTPIDDLINYEVGLFHPTEKGL